MQRAKNRHERFIVTHRGDPQAVILGIEEFLAVIAPSEEKLEALLLTRLKDSETKAFNIEDVRKGLAKRLSKGKKRRT
jgi:Antitoxin Phd_YefM, type II toxin-antitoxin system